MKNKNVTWVYLKAALISYKASYTLYWKDLHSVYHSPYQPPSYITYWQLCVSHPILAYLMHEVVLNKTEDENENQTCPAKFHKKRGSMTIINKCIWFKQEILQIFSK